MQNIIFILLLGKIIGERSILGNISSWVETPIWIGMYVGPVLRHGFIIMDSVSPFLIWIYNQIKTKAYFGFPTLYDIWYIHISMYVHALSCATLWDPLDSSPPDPLSRGFSRQEYWNELPFSPPGDLPNPGTESVSWVFDIGRWILYHWSLGKPMYTYMVN